MLAAHDWFDDASVFVVDVPLACCALETQAAAQGRAVVEVSSIPEDAKIVVTLSGTITEPVIPAVRRMLDLLPTRAEVVAFGACSCLGGPYWDSYSVVQGGGELVHISHFIAGCPPPPEVLDRYLEAVRNG